MSLRDLCDTAYVMQVEQIERHANALTVMSESKEPLPDVLRREFDDWLLSDPPEAKILSTRARQMQALMEG